MSKCKKRSDSNMEEGAITEPIKSLRSSEIYHCGERNRVLVHIIKMCVQGTLVVANLD